jgi:hypothetical protein
LQELQLAHRVAQRRRVRGEARARVGELGIGRGRTLLRCGEVGVRALRRRSERLPQAECTGSAPRRMALTMMLLNTK